MEEDSLKINYDEDAGVLSFEWDETDPKWNFLKDLTEQDINTMLQSYLDELEHND